MEKKREEICLVQKVCMGQNGHSAQWITGLISVLTQNLFSNTKKN